MHQKKSGRNQKSTRYWDDSDWSIAHAQMISEQYPDQWVAIYNKKVVAHHKKLGQVAMQVRKLGVDDPVFTFSERGSMSIVIPLRFRSHYDSELLSQGIRFKLIRLLAESEKIFRTAEVEGLFA